MERPEGSTCESVTATNSRKWTPATWQWVPSLVFMLSGKNWDWIARDSREVKVTLQASVGLSQPKLREKHY